MFLSHQETWRFVPVITAGIAVLQILAGSKIRESPVWLSHKSGSSETDDGDHSTDFTADNDAGKLSSIRPLLAKF